MDESDSEIKRIRRNLDDLDFQLIDLLYTDSRMKYAEIAEIIGISVGSVHNRIKALEERGVIKKFTVQLDSEKLGLDLTVIIEMQIEVSFLPEVNIELQKIPHIISLYNITGGTDIIAIARFKNRRQMNEILQSILKIKHITRTATHLALQILKEEWHTPKTMNTNNAEIKTDTDKLNMIITATTTKEKELEVEK